MLIDRSSTSLQVVQHTAGLQVANVQACDLGEPWGIVGVDERGNSRNGGKNRREKHTEYLIRQPVFRELILRR